MLIDFKKEYYFKLEIIAIVLIKHNALSSMQQV